MTGIADKLISCSNHVTVSVRCPTKESRPVSKTRRQINQVMVFSKINHIILQTDSHKKCSFSYIWITKSICKMKILQKLSNPVQGRLSKATLSVYNFKNSDIFVRKAPTKQISTIHSCDKKKKALVRHIPSNNWNTKTKIFQPKLNIRTDN